jgi:hypothetical protein
MTTTMTVFDRAAKGRDVKDYSNLVQRLREQYLQLGSNYVQAAADAIESLSAEVVRLTRVLDAMRR